MLYQPLTTDSSFGHQAIAPFHLTYLRNALQLAVPAFPTEAYSAPLSPAFPILIKPFAIMGTLLVSPMMDLFQMSARDTRG